MTSAWLSGVVWMPAAMFVISENPRISMPAWRAAMASRAVDMPTMCPPMAFAICTSAGVSYCGPRNWQ